VAGRLTTTALHAARILGVASDTYAGIKKQELFKSAFADAREGYHGYRQIVLLPWRLCHHLPM
jgi:hypothetical protein